MQSWEYSVTSINTLLLTLFDKYSQLLKKRFSEDFQEIVATDDYMPMPINTLDEYDKVVNVSWYTSDKPREELTSVSVLSPNAFANRHQRFPCVLPFSQMYPLCCIDIRNFLNQMYLFSDDNFQRSSVIDETLKNVSVLLPRPCFAVADATPVSRRPALRKGLQDARGAPELPVSGSNRPDPHQPGAF